MPGAAWRYRVGVQGTEITHIVSDDGTPLSSRECQDLRIRERRPVRLLGHGLHIVASCAEFAADDGSQHFVEQEPHCFTAACPAPQAACASAASCSLASIH